MSNIFKKFLTNVGVGAAIQIVRGYMNEQLKDVKPSDLYLAIIQDKDLWQFTPQNLKKTGRSFKNTYGKLLEKYEKEITTELLLTWISEDHPALYSTIINTDIGGQKTGVIWFDKQVRKIKQKILEM